MNIFSRATQTNHSSSLLTLQLILLSAHTQNPMTLQSTWSCGLMDKALVFGTKDCRFESCQGHMVSRPRREMDIRKCSCGAHMAWCSRLGALDSESRQIIARPNWCKRGLMQPGRLASWQAPCSKILSPPRWATRCFPVSNSTSR